ncbi:MAG TPA: hypothetical protein VMU37_06350 [Caulobacteraceae bacterium]|nr:hypothetical protein [Caulobacteraceae bacterium]
MPTKAELESAIGKLERKVARLNRQAASLQAESQRLTKEQKVKDKLIESYESEEALRLKEESEDESSLDRCRARCRELERQLIVARSKTSSAPAMEILRSRAADDPEQIERLKAALLRERERSARLEATIETLRAGLK